MQAMERLNRFDNNGLNRIKSLTNAPTLKRCLIGKIRKPVYAT